MKQFVYVALLAGSVWISSLSCSSSKKSRMEVWEEYGSETVVPGTFVLPGIPASLTDPDERAYYLIRHFWDRFDFADRELTRRPAITEQAFVDYIHLIAFLPAEESGRSLLHTLHRAEADTSVFVYFVSLMEKYLYDPNSPFRNEEQYIPVLKEVTASSLLAEKERLRYRSQLVMTLKNRVGQKANNITCSLASGESFSLWDLRSQYVLLLFSHPGWPACEAVTRRLESSPALNRALAMNSPTRTMLTILTVYPDSDSEEWKAHLPDLPKQWLHADDRAKEIIQKQLYDLKTIPALYLLDQDKKVIFKETSVETVESFFSVSG